MKEFAKSVVDQLKKLLEETLVVIFSGVYLWRAFLGTTIFLLILDQVQKARVFLENLRYSGAKC